MRAIINEFFQSITFDIVYPKICVLTGLSCLEGYKYFATIQLFASYFSILVIESIVTYTLNTILISYVKDSCCVCMT